MGEKRRFLRFNIPLRIELVLGADVDMAVRGEAVDFSREGLKVTVAASARGVKDSLAEIKAYLPNQHIPVVFQARMKWIKPKGDTCEMGFKIEDINPKDKSEILDYAYHIWRENIKA